jgi:gas vesicle protein
MADERNSGAGGVLVAFTIGAILGAVVALLVAPAKGEETRETLSGRAKAGAQKTREFLKTQRETLSTAVDRGREAYHAAREKEQA